MFCLTESAPFTAQEISITGKSEVCGRFQNFIGPLIQVILADLIGRNVLTPGLVDGHADRIDVINIIEKLQSAKGVTLHLWIVFGGNKDSKTVFIVNYGIVPSLMRIASEVPKPCSTQREKSTRCSIRTTGSEQICLASSKSSIIKLA